jgi:hypothetical protein
VRKQLLTISSRFQNERNGKRVQKRANSIQVIDNKVKKKVRKRLIGNDKRIVSISLKDNYIVDKETKKKVENSINKGSLYSKYIIENGHFYKLPERYHQKYRRAGVNLPKNKRNMSIKMQENLSTKKKENTVDNYENIFSSKQKIILHKQRKRIFETLKMNKVPKEVSIIKRVNDIKDSKSSELRPYSAPIDGKVIEH